jgi:hypothetical protein
MECGVCPFKECAQPGICCLLFWTGEDSDVKSSLEWG